jgi:hypothetical protein
MSEETWVSIILCIAVVLFAVFFRDAFMATSDFLDSSRCAIGMDYCKDK